MKISQRAFDLIVAEEVSSKATYEKKYRAPEWPGVASGVTVGIGYDVGYHTPEQVRADWGGRIPDNMVRALERTCGVTGIAAQNLAHSLRDTVDVPWEAAIAVYKDVDVPKWTAIVEKALANTEKLPPDSLGALVSLTYNRGPSYSTAGDRYREMRLIKQHMTGGTIDEIPNEIRSMKRLWPGVGGLLARREREAKLFERGLNPPVAPGAGTGGTIATTTVIVANEANKQGVSGDIVGAIVVAGLVLAVAAYFTVRHFRR